MGGIEENDESSKSERESRRGERPGEDARSLRDF